MTKTLDEIKSSHGFRDEKYFTLYDKLHLELLSSKFCVCDVDQIEYRFINGKRIIVALLEVKESLNTLENLRIIMMDFKTRDARIRSYFNPISVMYELAECLDIDTYIVIHTSDCEHFFVTKIDDKHVCLEMNRTEYYGNFLTNLKPRM